MFIALGEKFKRDKVASNIPAGMFWTSVEEYGFSFTDGRKYPFRLVLRQQDREKYKNPKLQEQLKERAIKCLKDNEDRIWKEAVKYLEETKGYYGEENVLSKPEMETAYQISRTYDHNEWAVCVTFEFERIKEHGYSIWVRFVDNMIVRSFSGDEAEWPAVKMNIKSSKEVYDINRAASENFIKNMISSGRIAVSEAAADEFNEELNSETEMNDEENIMEEGIDDVDGGMGMAPDGIDDMYEEEEPEPEPVEKIHTIDTLSQITNRFDQNMAEIGFTWDSFIINGRIRKAPNFKYVEDMRTHLNKLFNDKEFRYVQIYNKLYDFLTDTNLAKSWNVFGRENMGKPYLAEGAALLMYELTVEWVPVIVRYYKESPVFSKDIAPEEDSFFKKFPNLNLLTYVAAIVVENKEFRKLLTSQKSKDLLLDEGKYNLIAKQAKSKPGLRGLGESLSYYAGLVKENFGDITAGYLDKIAVVAFLNNNTKMPMNDRLSLVERLIKIVTTPVVNTDPNQPDPLMSALDVLNQTCTEFVKNRAEAKITLDSNEKNFPTVFIDSSARG